MIRVTSIDVLLFSTSKHSLRNNNNNVIAFAYYSESDDSPGMYFNVGGPVELRAPTMERAALYLDMALSQISNHAYAPATVFTLHVYQYNLEQQGKRE